MFYIGDVKCPDRETFRLSDLFGCPGAVEVECEVVNVNAGRNAQVAAACPMLAGYSEFVARVRRNCATMPVEEAVHAAVADCIAAGVLAEYLSGKRAEVADMFMTEFDEERQRRHDFEEGLEQGLEQGREQKQEQVLRNLMANMGCGLDEAMRLLGIPEDERGKYAE